MNMTTFRLETDVPCWGSQPWSSQICDFPKEHDGRTWALIVKRHPWVNHLAHQYQVDVKPPRLPPRSKYSFKPYERTNDDDVVYNTTAVVGKGASYLRAALNSPVNFVGAEVTLTTLGERTSKFKSPEQVPPADVALNFGNEKFYANKTVLSAASPTFARMFSGGFLELNAPEVDVTKEHVTAEDFDEFLGCLYPLSDGPEECYIVGLTILARYYEVVPLYDKCVNILLASSGVSTVEKFLLAVNVQDTDLEDRVLELLTKDDIRELVEIDTQDSMGYARLKKLTKRSLAL